MDLIEQTQNAQINLTEAAATAVQDLLKKRELDNLALRVFVSGGGFKIENPNAVSTCGCGSSFRTSGDPSANPAGGCSC